MEDPTVREIAAVVKHAVFDRPDGSASSSTKEGLSTKIALALLAEYRIEKRENIT